MAMAMADRQLDVVINALPMLRVIRRAGRAVGKAILLSLMAAGVAGTQGVLAAFGRALSAPRAAAVDRPTWRSGARGRWGGKSGRCVRRARVADLHFASVSGSTHSATIQGAGVKATPSVLTRSLLACGCAARAACGLTLLP